MSNDPHCRLNNLRPEAEVITCAQCDELLDAYLDAAIAQLDVSARYPALWRHLQTCASCAHHYHTLSTILYPDQPTQPPPLVLEPLDLPFLSLTQPPLPEEVQYPWQIHLGSGLLGEPLQLRFTFSPAYLQQCLTDTAQQEPATSPEANKNAQLVRSLLQEQLRFGQQSMLVDVRALSLADQKDAVHIQATLTGSHPLPDGIWATLHWGGQASTCRLNNRGEASFGAVPLAALQASKGCVSPVFSISFGAAE